MKKENKVTWICPNPNCEADLRKIGYVVKWEIEKRETILHKKGKNGEWKEKVIDVDWDSEKKTDVECALCNSDCSEELGIWTERPVGEWI